MSLFDKLKRQAAQNLEQTVRNAVASAGNKSYTVTFSQLPVSLEQMKAVYDTSKNTICLFIWTVPDCSMHLLHWALMQKNLPSIVTV